MSPSVSLMRHVGALCRLCRAQPPPTATTISIRSPGASAVCAVTRAGDDLAVALDRDPLAGEAEFRDQGRDPRAGSDLTG